MAILKKQKQIAKDPILAAAPRAEHGFVTFAHLNVLVEKINELEARIIVLETP
jgi:uncharacterized protein YdcH (DUF465 family)